MKVKKLILQFTVTTVTILGIVTVVIGFAHTPYGRQTFLGKAVMNGLSSICPVKTVSVEKVDQMVERGMVGLRTDQVTSERPALGFTLDETTEGDALQVMKEKGIPCDSKKIGYVILRCHEQSGDEMTLTFGGSGKLKSLSLYRVNLSTENANEIWNETSYLLQKHLGEPTVRVGERKLYPSHSLLDLHSYEYRFQNYYAKVTLMNKGTGKVLYERYQSAL